MLFFVGEGNEFGFYRGTVARPDALNLSVVEGRIGQSFLQYFVYFGVGIASPTR